MKLSDHFKDQVFPDPNNPEHCETIYGPIQSRRHGLSLGINLGDPVHKICTWGCVYCQCGMGTRSATNLWPEKTEVIRLLKLKLKAHPHLDSITFAGNSEPSSHPDFLSIVQEVLKIRSEQNQKWIINTLSNGSELDRPEVIEALNLLDEAWIKLDCTDQDLYQRLNRPIAKVSSIKNHIQNIKQLSQIRLQTLLWTSDDERLSNSKPEALDQLIEAYKDLNPLEIHLYTVARMTAVDNLLPLLRGDLEKFKLRIQNELQLTKVKIFI